MIRALLYALISIVAITFIRMVAGIIMKAFGDSIREDGGSKAATRARGNVPVSGELKGCKVCGTYVVASSALTALINGQTVYYCSEECRNKG